jgi:hypothetical protein
VAEDIPDPEGVPRPEPDSESGEAVAPDQPLFGKAESVEQCMAIIGEVSAEQRARARHLDTKTGTIAGFCATVLTLNVTLGRPLLEASVSNGEHTIIRWLFLVGSLALALAALVAVAGVLSPMGHDDLTEQAIDAYSDRPKMITPPEQLRETWLRSVTEMTKSDRFAGKSKADRAKWAVWLLALGLICVAGEAITLFSST